ncbi:MAG: hypothetical protein K0R99_3206 [Microbacterium sp.]|jgi:hypothetical protein|nr:hypothetical protein [Microbacterium sp.]
MHGKSRGRLLEFLASPQLHGHDGLLGNLYERDGCRDYVLVSGGTTVETHDVIRDQDDGELAYLLGPSLSPPTVTPSGRRRSLRPLRTREPQQPTCETGCPVKPYCRHGSLLKPLVGEDARSPDGVLPTLLKSRRPR